MDWYYARNGRQFGPHTEEQLRQLIAEGRVLPTDAVWKAGMPAWVPLHDVFPPAGGPPPPPPAAPLPQLQPYPPQPRPAVPGLGPPPQRVGYILLGVFLGVFGVHNFYAGYHGRGIAQLLLSVLSCGFLSIASWIWAIVEICTVTTDARGRLMP